MTSCLQIRMQRALKGDHEVQ